MRHKLIRDVNNAKLEGSETAARRQGCSLAQELREHAEADRPLEPGERLAASRAVKALQTRPATALTLDEIREGLE